MSSALSLRSPLAAYLTDHAQPGSGLTDPGVVVSERPFLGYANLRAEPTQDLLEHVEDVIGIRLPLEPNTFTETYGNITLWLGPNEWLIITPRGHQVALANLFRMAVQDIVFAFTDVTHGYTTIHVSGAKAIAMLSKGSSLDLELLKSQTNGCAQTLLAKAHVTIRIVDTSPAIELIVRRSFAEYLARWIQDAALEYGFKVST